MMTCQQLTIVCIFMSTYQIAPAQRVVNGRFIQDQLSLLNNGLPRPPKGYHYENLQHIWDNYPSKSYKIRFGLSNIIRNNNKRGKSSSSKRGSNSNNKSKNNKKPKDQSADNFPLSESSENPAADPAADPAANPQGGTSSPDPTGTA